MRTEAWHEMHPDIYFVAVQVTVVGKDAQAVDPDPRPLRGALAAAGAGGGALHKVEAGEEFMGTVARMPSKLTTGPDRLQLQRTTGSGFRPGERVEIISAGIVPADSEVADALEVEEGASVVHRRRQYLDEDGVIALSTSWLPGELAEAAPELIVTGPLPKMTFGLIEDRTGRRAVKRRDSVSIEELPEDVAPLLDLTPGTPVLSMANSLLGPERPDHRVRA
ncbi:UTRA domain-containing protein [Streptomyces sp. NPDC004673]